MTKRQAWWHIVLLIGTFTSAFLDQPLLFAVGFVAFCYWPTSRQP